MSLAIDMTGQRFSRWTVLERGFRKGSQLHWRCRCDCGTERLVQGANLRQGLTLSCGCIQRATSLKEAFFSVITPGDPNECWPWPTVHTTTGYGALSHDGQAYGAHRASYEIHRGPIPPGLFVCHHCDNRPCVNPAHLFLGTAADNAADMAAKGRASRCGPTRPSRGMDQPQAKLDDEKVRYIRRSSKGGPALADEFGVSRKCISLVRRRQSWAHVD